MSDPREYCPRCGGETAYVIWYEDGHRKDGWSCEQCDIREETPPYDPYTDYFDDGGWSDGWWDKGDYDSPFSIDTY